MPRKKRIWQPNMCHHVMLRGVGGMFLFKDKADGIRFCLLLQEAAEAHKHRVHAFCLIGNHIHLMLEPTSQELPLAGCVHAFAFRYAQYFNKRYKRRGYLYQGRFRSILVEDGLYIRRLARYIHLNPVEAGLVLHPGDYQWSSHNAYFGTDAFVWLETDRVLARFGENPTEARERLLEFTSQKLEVELDFEEIQKATRVGVFGSEEFVRVYAPDSLDDEDANALTSESGKTFEDVIDAVCLGFDVTLEDLRGSGKNTHIVDARSVRAYACRHIPGASLGDVCRKLDKHHGTVSKLAKRVEERESLQEAAHRLLITT